MKSVISRILIVAISLLSSVSGFAQINCTGMSRIGFANNPLAQVVHESTGVPVDNTFMVGLFYSPDLSAKADDFILAATAPVIIQGIFSNGGNFVELPVAPTLVQVEIRAWNNGHTTYENALLDMDAHVGRSGILPNLIQTADLDQPAPNLYIQGGLGSFSVSAVPEPSTMALGVVGFLSGLFLFRSRRRVSR